MLILIKKQREGFTLVELSIVLVIIGLLIGGILAAQSMISTSKVEAVAMQIGQFDAGVESFKTKYNYLPGDAPAFGGDGNGVISLTCCGYYAAGFGGEIANFWGNYDSTQFVATSVANAPVQEVFTGPNKNVPLSKLGSKNAFFIVSGITTDGAHADPANQINYYAILDGSQAQTAGNAFTSSYSLNSPVKPVDLLALDKKIDDGLADNGNVLSGKMANSYQGAISVGPYSTSCSTNSVYNVTSGYECTPLIRIGAQTGDLQ